MTNDPKRPDTYSFFVTKDQSDILRDALDALEREYQTRTVTEALHLAFKDLRRRIINLRDAIKRREKKETSHGKATVPTSVG